MGPPDAQRATTVPPTLTLSQPMLRDLSGSDDDNQDAGPADAARDAARDNTEAVKKLSEAEIERQIAQREKGRFAAAEFALRQAVEQLPDPKRLVENLISTARPKACASTSSTGQVADVRHRLGRAL